MIKLQKISLYSNSNNKRNNKFIKKYLMMKTILLMKINLKPKIKLFNRIKQINIFKPTLMSKL